MPTRKLWPLLAGTIHDLKDVLLPVYASPKIDGFRMMVQGGQALSRNLKPIRNEYTCKLFSNLLLEGLDGELVAGDWLDPAAFGNTSSLCTTRAGEPDVTFHVFDLMALKTKYEDRLAFVRQLVTSLNNKYPKLPVRVVPQVPVYTHMQLIKLYEKWEKQGYEGIMLRSFDGEYKQGNTPSGCRSTVSERILLKFKPMEDAEAVIIGTYEQEENTNTKTKQADGTMKRSSHKAGKVKKGVLGGFYVKPMLEKEGYTMCDCLFGKPCKKHPEFKVATGITDADRAKFWMMRKQLVGKVLKYRYQAKGQKNAPRIPVFLGLRPKSDM